MLTWKERKRDDLVAFWTNGEVFVEVWSKFFEKMWDEAVEIRRKLGQVEGHTRTNIGRPTSHERIAGAGSMIPS